MKRIRGTVWAWAVTAALVGCAGTGDAQYSGQVQVASPELVPVDPDVEVVADADQPLFYSEGYYWLYIGGLWLRSDDYRGAFVRVDINLVPAPVRGIHSPTAYVHYRQHNNVAQRQEAPRPALEDRARDHEAPRDKPPVVAPRPEPRSTDPVEAERDHTVRPTEPKPTTPEQQPPVANPMPKPATSARESGAERERPQQDDR